MRTTSACAPSILLAIHAAMAAAAAISSPATPHRVGENSMRIAAGYGELSLAFEANRGQAEGAIRYMACGHGFGLAPTDDEARFYLQPAAGNAPTPGARRIGARHRVRFRRRAGGRWHCTAHVQRRHRADSSRTPSTTSRSGSRSRARCSRMAGRSASEPAR